MISIRASMIPSFCDCPRRAACRQFGAEINEQGYNTCKRTLPPIGAPVGTAVHAAGKYFLEFERADGELPPVNVGLEHAVSVLELEAAEGVTFDATTPNLSDAKKQVETLSRVFYFDVASKMTFSGLETRRKGKVSPEIEITGSSDYENTTEINDLKTGTTCGNCSGQLGAYSLLRQSSGMSKPKILNQFYLPRVSIKKPQPELRIIPYDVERSEKMAWFTIQHIAACMQKFLDVKEPWAFMVNPMSRMCSPKYCPAYDTDWCREGK